MILFGGLLLVLSSILEFIIGNTFSSVAFGHLGRLCLENEIVAVNINIPKVHSVWLLAQA